MAFDPQAIIDFVGRTREAASQSWDASALRGIATTQVPPDVLGPSAWLIEADARLTWASWFIDAVVDRQQFVRAPHLGYSHLYSRVLDRLLTIAPMSPADELRSCAAAVSDLAWDDVSVRRQLGRQRITRQMKEDLWFAAEPSPRCYLCGYLFSAPARDRLLGRSRENAPTTPELPLLVDFVRPRGATARDLGIEVDHVAAVATGGATSIENLRLACGWCNRVKGAHSSLYDVSAREAGWIRIRDLGTVSLPQPFWIVRLVATRARCEDPAGCATRLSTAELFVAPRNTNGVLNPMNAAVYCRDHDPWSTTRYVSRLSYLNR